MHCPLNSGGDPEAIVSYTAGLLQPESEAAFEQHLQSCADCKRMVEQQRGVWAALDAWAPPAVSPAFDQALFARIEAEAALPWWRHLFSFKPMLRPAMPIAAAVALLAAGFFWKESVPRHQVESTHMENAVDIEQVDRALDDMNMLQQLSPVKPTTAAAAAQPL